MRASPQNRSRVYRAIRTALIDQGAPLAPPTIAQRTGLDEETVEACCAALSEDGAVQLRPNTRGEPRWTIAPARRPAATAAAK